MDPIYGTLLLLTHHFTFCIFLLNVFFQYKGVVTSTCAKELYLNYI